jgi:hypothetical protein
VRGVRVAIGQSNVVACRRFVNSVEMEMKMKTKSIIVGQVPSDSNPSKFHTIRKDTVKGILFCSCPSWRFSKEDPKTCKHLVKFIADHAAAAVIPAAPEMPELRIVSVKFVPKDKPSAKPAIFFWLSDRATKSFKDFVLQRFTPADALRPLVSEVLKPIGRNGVKVSWSQYAGCKSCPCSPGFTFDDRSYAFDIHVDYEPKKVSTRKSA